MYKWQLGVRSVVHAVIGLEIACSTIHTATAQTSADAKADVTDAGTQPRGKQIRTPHGIWYTPTTGIVRTTC